MTAEELDAFLRRAFPNHPEDQHALVESVEPMHVRLRRPYNERYLRPGGTLSGPTLMALADRAMYSVVLAMGGEGCEQAVTTNLTINFLSRPEPADLLARARLLKLGRRLAVGEISLFTEGREDPVAHASVTYALPAGL